MSKVAPQQNFEQLYLSKVGDPADPVFRKEAANLDPAAPVDLTKKEEKTDEPIPPQTLNSGAMEAAPAAVADSSSFVEAAADDETEATEVKLQPRFKSISRSRVVSLDRGKDEMEEAEALTQGYNSSDSTGNRHLIKSKQRPTVSPDDGEGEDTSGADTSDGESSYFAKHLPSPKSSRPYSVSCDGSVSSAPARADLFPGPPGSLQRRESDASLSFSDDDDDDDDWTEEGSGIPSSRRSPLLPPPTSVEQRFTPEMHQGYQITRMHSVSSLVSSSDSESGGAAEGSYNRRVANTTGVSAGESSDDSGETSTSDPSVRSELRDVASSKKNYVGRSNSNTGNTPSGRKSPTLGMETADGSTPQTGMPAGRVFTSPPHHHPQASPPPIANDHANLDARGVAHPQPQPFSPEQMAAWMAAGGGAAVSAPQFVPPMYHARPPVGYGSTNMAPNYPAQYAPHGGHPRRDDSFNSQNSRSTSESVLVYSDDDTDEQLGHQFAGGVGDASSSFPTAGGGPGGAPLNASREGANAGGNNSHSNGRSLQQGSRSAGAAVAKGGGHGEGPSGQDEVYSSSTGFKVYNRRWLMLFYMSMLNLLSDWTCYSVAPIAVLTSEAYGDVDPELLVTVFLASNAFASACEPIILSRLGLRRTVIFGGLLLMIGSIIKSGGLPPILPSDLIKGKDGWRVYLGFFLVGLSQPLYQCTPALLSASWFPEKERTMATGVALNANQLGIGCAFVFGTLLVETADDIPSYFGLLSIISTLMFMGTLVQFEDAPPTPPSDTARVIRGTLEINIPGMADSIWRSVRSFQPEISAGRKEKTKSSKSATKNSPTRADAKPASSSKSQSRRRSKRSSKSGSGNTRRRTAASSNRNQAPNIEAPSPALPGSTEEFYEQEKQLSTLYALAPSPMMPGPVGQHAPDVEESDDREESPLYENLYSPDDEEQEGVAGQAFVAHQGVPPGMPYAPNPYYPGMPPGLPMHPQMQYPYGYPGYPPQYPGYPPQPPPGYYYPPIPQDPSYDPYYYQQSYSHYNPYEYPRSALPGAGTIEDMAEPVLTVTPNHLDIDIRDDQVIMSIRACFARPGFIHCLVSFTASGIVINTLSTFMDYLVRLNGAGREFVGIVGGSFQAVIMISSLVIGGQTDKSRAYYSVTVAMLVLGAFGLAECGVSLDADRGGDLRWALIIVAVLVGPLQPVSTELGVEVVYPISENTVLVIQQLFSNLLSAAFIPFFKALRDVGREDMYEEEMYERPQYTFSFYLLIVLHAVATVFFATFNGRYLRYEHEKQKKAREEAKIGAGNAFHPVNDGDYYHQEDSYEDEQAEYSGPRENQPLLEQAV
mmetsp:Transcript_10095/g.14279  ORF Transcript_10095/g.14279 Transcript_10095/m.14279 type:complete len:1330 (-) Transcript_10095:72-4061(-)